MIPRKIFTIWLSEDGSIPDVIQKCIQSQVQCAKDFGYEHRLITLDNCFKHSEYMIQAMNSPHRDGIKFCKMSDYLRMHYLYTEGGIYLDADVSVIPGKNFDDLLDNGMFAARENNGFIGAATVASVPGHPFVRKWIETVEQNWRGDDDKNFESSMEILTDGYARWGLNDDFRLYETRFFFPYDWQRATIDVTEDTRSFHHFYKSWISTAPDLLPRVSVILPHLDTPDGKREDGLRRCLASIDRLYYPKHLIETIVLDGPGTVPEKVAKGLKQAQGDVLVYAANDMTFEPDSLYKAVVEAMRHRGLVAFGGTPVIPDEGNICEHFVIHRDLIQYLDKGEIFSTDFNHVGCDNWLWAQAKKLGKALHLAEAKVTHYHFSHGSPQDEVYAKGWSRIEEDRAILKAKLATLHGRPGHQSTPGRTQETEAGSDDYEAED